MITYHEINCEDIKNFNKKNFNKSSNKITQNQKDKYKNYEWIDDNCFNTEVYKYGKGVKEDAFNNQFINENEYFKSLTDDLTKNRTDFTKIKLKPRDLRTLAVDIHRHKFSFKPLFDKDELQ